jgi:hypothetical protein
MRGRMTQASSNLVRTTMITIAPDRNAPTPLATAKPVLAANTRMSMVATLSTFEPTSPAALLP